MLSVGNNCGRLSAKKKKKKNSVLKSTQNIVLI